MKTIISGLTLVTLILLTACMAGAAQSPGRWELLGQREVDFKADHDQIDVGRSEGRFKQLQLGPRMRPSKSLIWSVTFGNDTTFTPKLRHKFTEKSASRIIDLPGERRTIKRIDFNYKSINRREGKGTVEVLGR